MLGSARTWRRGRTVVFEFLKLTAVGTRVIYRAWPAGKQGTPFTLTASGPSHAVFENPTHDFPQRISYHRRGETLEATISGRLRRPGQPEGPPQERRWRFERR